MHILSQYEKVGQGPRAKRIETHGSHGLRVVAWATQDEQELEGSHEAGWKDYHRAGLISNVRRLRAILNAYPPNKSTAFMNMSRIAVSHRSGVPSRCGLPNTTIRTSANGTRDAMPSTTPMNRLLAAGNANGIGCRSHIEV